MSPCSRFTTAAITSSTTPAASPTPAISTRCRPRACYTAWFEQKLSTTASRCALGQTRRRRRIHHQPDTAGGLINGTFGWAGILGRQHDQRRSGLSARDAGRAPASQADRATSPRSPRCSPAIRPGANCNDNPQECNRYGTTFSFTGGSLWMGELQYAVNQGKQATGLPGVYKLGGWYATADFADQHFGVDGAGDVVSLADPTAAGPLNHRGNWRHLRASPIRWSGARTRQQPQSVRCAAAWRRPTAI